ncbi:chloride channel protein [Calditerrivibrio sp.]|uniref:Chloride channel protein n=1 Tax=Calditerrivibrio nitroreducens TaxID=477976 RepID=A0A2J6WJL9_9BACT|nr:MAG: chloride channel protein [Calditerrivibrio nitroreducens]
MAYNIVKKYNLPIVGKWFILGTIVGIVAGISAIIFYTLLQLTSQFFLQYLAGYIPPEATGDVTIFHFPAGEFNRFLLIGMPVVGALISAILILKFAPETEGAGLDAAISSIHKNKGLIRWQVPVIKTLTSSITIGSGGSGGGEGPISHIGAGVGSVLSQIFHLTEKERRILTAAGMGAGVGAIFRSPLSGAIFAAEVLYSSSDMEYEALLPSTITSIIAYSVFCSMFGWSPLFYSLNASFSNPLELIGYTILIIGCIFVGHFYTKVYHKVKSYFDVLKLKKLYKMLFGALLTGLIGFLVPDVMGAGYSIIDRAIQSDLSVNILLVIILAKIFATAFTIGSGGSAGTFAPTMVIGASTGGVIGLLINKYFPLLAPMPGAYAIVGMAGFLSGLAKTPLSAIIMVSELTGNYQLIVPAMWVSTITFLSLRKVKFYKSQMQFRSDSPIHKNEYFLMVLQEIKVKDIMKKDPIVIKEDMKFDDIIHFIPTTKHNSFPVVDNENRLVGVLRFEEIREFVFEEGLEELVVASEICDKDAPTVIKENNLAEAIELIGTRNVELLPVVDEENRVIGIVTRRDIIATYNKEMLKQKKQTEETIF